MVINVYVLSFWGLRHQTHTRALPRDPLGDYCHQSPGFVPIRNKFLATPLAGEVKEMKGEGELEGIGQRERGGRKRRREKGASKKCEA